MKTSIQAEQEIRLPAPASQSSAARSQSLDRPYNFSPNRGIQSQHLLSSVSPQSLPQSLSPGQNLHKSPDQRLDEALNKVILLATELERVNRLNVELTKENESLKAKVKTYQENDLSSKLALILAENAKLNYALEKMRDAYQKEKLQNSRVSHRLSNSEIGNRPSVSVGPERSFSKATDVAGSFKDPNLPIRPSTPPINSKDKNLGVSSEQRAHVPENDNKDEDYEKKIITLYVQNDKLNDALEKKIKEVNALSVKLGDSIRKSHLSNSQSILSESHKKELREVGMDEKDSISLAKSQDFSGMVNVLLSENGKLIDLVNKKEQEVNDLKTKLTEGESVKDQSRNSDILRKSGHENLRSPEHRDSLGSLKLQLDELIDKNNAIKQLLSEQTKTIESQRHNFSTLDHFKGSINKLIEENHKTSQIIGESIHSLREELVAVLNAPPSNLYELKAKVSILSEEKENLSNVLRDKLTEIGSLKQEISQLKSSHLQMSRSDLSTGGITDLMTTDDLSHKARFEERLNLEKDKEFQALKALVYELQDNSAAQSGYFREFKTKMDNMISEITKLSLAKSKKNEEKERAVKRFSDPSVSGRVVFGDVSNVESQRNQENNLSVQDFLSDKMKDFDSLKQSYVDIKHCVTELLTTTKKDEVLKSQVSSLVQENERINSTLKEREKTIESLVQQLKRLQEGYLESTKAPKASNDNFEEIIEKMEEIRRNVCEYSEQGVEETRDVKSNLTLVLSELTQLKKDFVSHYLEMKTLKGMISTQDQDKLEMAQEEERMRNVIKTLTQEKEQMYVSLRQKDTEVESLRGQKKELNEQVMKLAAENKNLARLLEEREMEINYLHDQMTEFQENQERMELHHQKEEHPERPTVTDAGRTTPGELASRTDIDVSYSEDATPQKAQIKRRPLTEEEAIVQENFQGKIDIVFCVDCTKSMDPYIANAKLACSKIISVMNQSKSNFPLDLTFGFVGYRDHGQFNGNTWVTKVHDLSTPEECIAFINKMDAYSSVNNDFPEAVMPALWDCTEKITWRDNTREKVVRIVFHIADAPPHGRKFYKGKNDHYPKGDPSGITTDQVAQRFADLGISYKLLKIGKFLDLMEKVFKQAFLDMDSMELKRAEQLDQMTTTILIKHLDMINNQVSVKDKRFLNLKPKGNVKRSEKIGQCYFTSVLFDDYFEYFVEENILDFKVRTLNLFYTKEAVIGIQCIYVTKDEEIEAPARIATNNGVRKVSLEFGSKEYLTEISGEVDQKENLCSLTLMTNMNKRIQVGGPGARKFKLPTPSGGFILVGIGGSFRNRGIDSLYFYYS